MNRLLQLFIRGYQRFGSPILHALAGPLCGCRYSPTCSQYFLDALKIHGSLRGLALGLWRLLRCQPWGGSGMDPVPPRRPASRAFLDTLSS
ncbi:MAG: membrane protein insertion efficiency factor YidD [Verrucomicrobiota bacterium]